MQVRLEISNMGLRKGEEMRLKEIAKSIDMVDLIIDINSFDFEQYIKPKIDILEYDIRLDYWTSFGWNKYRHNWTWTTKEYSFYFAYSSNLKEEYKTRFRLSFNPNKVNEHDDMLEYLINIMKAYDIKIQSVDVAFDYEGVTTSELRFDKEKKRDWKIHKYPNSDLTYYLGKSGCDGHVKVYDKASEENKNLKKKEDIDYNKTRYEITVKVNERIENMSSWKCRICIPPMYIQNEIGDKNLKPTDKLLVFSIKNGYPIDELTYEQRRRYKKIMSEVNYQYTEIQPSQFAVEKVVKDYFHELFY